jgi:putative endonuclease
MKQYYVYMMASKKNGTLYIGMTNDLIKRVYQHKNNIIKGFSEKYSVHRLVYYETYRYFKDAINREKQLKRWKRAWKIRLIEQGNPNWEDLYPKLMMDSETITIDTTTKAQG